MTAFEWGITPYQFWSLSGEEQALMIEFIFEKLDMTAYEDMRRKLSG